MKTTAMYLRLSSEDADLKGSDKEESNSITNQRDLLNAFIRRTPELAETNVIEFCDDGWSGKNFERPAFIDMIEQVKQRKIQCIITKDFSRFGRDYLVVGNYISSVFPFLGVRFISVNDGFDSIRPTDVDSLETSFMILLYDFYSRDLSRKVRSVKKFRAQQGEFLSPFAPYGYVKDPNDKAHLIIDPEAAETVRRIFRLRADGITPEQIAAILNRDAVPTRMRCKRAAGCSRSNWPSIWEDNFWTVSAINQILQDERYTGKNIYGKYTRDKIGHKHVVSVRCTDWIIVENTHESIITQEEFERVRTAIRSHSEHDGQRKRSSLISGKVRCGVCHYAMTRSTGRHPYFSCRTPHVNAAYICAKKIPESDILEAVSEGLHVQALTAVDLHRLWEERNRKQMKDVSYMVESLSELKKTHKQLCEQICGMYESYALGVVSKEEYLAAKDAAAKQRDAAGVRIAEIEAALTNMGKGGGLQNGFVSALEKYAEVEEITREIIAEVLHEVRVYPEGRLEIVWNFCDELERLKLDLQEG